MAKYRTGGQPGKESGMGVCDKPHSQGILGLPARQQKRRKDPGLGDGLKNY